jgi:glucokinase
MSVIALDLGGTALKGALFQNKIVKKRILIPSNGSVSSSAIFAALKQAVETLDDGNVERIGLVSAGTIDPEKGVCTYATENLKGWTGFPIKAKLERAFPYPVYVDNDAIGALIGEASLLKDPSDVTMLTFGTGVGGASFIHGILDRSDKTRWGHYPLHPEGRLCSCGKKGCAEAYLSANALFLSAKELIPRLKGTRELMKLYGANDPRAIKVLEAYREDLLLFLEKIEEEIHPKTLILGGGLMDARDVFEPLVKDARVPIIFAQLGNEAGLEGARRLPFRSF